MKLTKNEYLPEERIESFFAYGSKPLTKIAGLAREKQLCRRFQLKKTRKIKSMLLLTDGWVFQCPYLASTYYERATKKLYLRVAPEIYIKKDQIMEIGSKLTERQKRDLKHAKKENIYVNLCKEKQVAFYIFVRSGRIYGVPYIKDTY